ncbi:MAG: hypothetical protein M3430_16395 [Acidobacteriota bacterium]|nr:hypothetical protein [Acidobacteriota bacterium]
MNEENTHNIAGGRSFEERVFARFDAMDARLNRMENNLSEMDARLERLEAKAYDTKPVWERALAEILAVSGKLDGVERKLNVLGLDMLTLRADHTRHEERIDKLESEPAS